MIITSCLVIAFMLLLMFLTLRKTVRKINEQSKNYFVDKLQDYDVLIDQKVDELNVIENKIAQLKKEIPNVTSQSVIPEHTAIPVTYNIKVPQYQDRAFLANYKKIKEKFEFQPEVVIKAFLDRYVYPDHDQEYLDYQALLAILDYETLYQLAIQSEQEQLQYLMQHLSTTERHILDGYLKGVSHFDILAFRHFLTLRLRELDPTIYVRTGEQGADYQHLNPAIQTEYDEKIYVGIMIIYHNKLYDYSL